MIRLIRFRALLPALVLALAALACSQTVRALDCEADSPCLWAVAPAAGLSFPSGTFEITGQLSVTYAGAIPRGKERAPWIFGVTWLYSGLGTTSPTTATSTTVLVTADRYTDPNRELFTGLHYGFGAGFSFISTLTPGILSTSAPYPTAEATAGYTRTIARSVSFDTEFFVIVATQANAIFWPGALGRFEFRF